jgi:hypothetical protein
VGSGGFKVTAMGVLVRPRGVDGAGRSDIGCGGAGGWRVCCGSLGG